MPKNKTVYLIIILSLLAITAAVLQVLSSRSPKEQAQSPAPQPVIQGPIDGSKPQSQFYVVRNDLPDHPIGITDRFNITFTKALSYKDLSISINPKEELVLSLDSTARVVTVKPKRTWDFDTTYTLTINPDTKSESGENLGQPSVITFKTASYGGI